LGIVSWGKLNDMSDNAPNPGGLGPADNSDITAQTPPIPPSGSQYPPSEWSRSAQPAPGSPSQSPLDWRQTTASQPVASTPPVAPDPAAYQNPYQSASYPVTYVGPSSPGAGGPVTGGPTPPWGPPAPATGRPSGVTRGLLAGVAALAIALTAGGVGGFVGYALHPDGQQLVLADQLMDLGHHDAQLGGDLGNRDEGWCSSWHGVSVPSG